MDCALPATGAGSAPTLIAAALAAALGAVLLVAARRRRPGPVLTVVLLVVWAGFTSSAPRAAAADDCPPQVTATSVEITAAPTTTPATTTPAGSTTTTEAQTTTTAVVVVTLCSTLTIDGEGAVVDVLLSLQDGAGAYSLYEPGSGCSGPQQEGGLVVDSDFFDPVTYCAENAPGSMPQQASSAGSWDPPLPDTYWACVPPSPEETTTTEAATTTTVVVETLCSTLSFEGTDAADALFVLSAGEGTYTVFAPGTACSGEQQTAGLLVDSDAFDPVAYCAENAPGSVPTPAASGTWTPPIPDTWWGCAPPEPEETTTTTVATTIPAAATTTTADITSSSVQGTTTTVAGDTTTSVGATTTFEETTTIATTAAPT